MDNLDHIFKIMGSFYHIFKSVGILDYIFKLMGNLTLNILDYHHVIQ